MRKSSDLPDRAEKLVDVAFTFADMEASSWFTQKLRGLLDIFQPHQMLSFFSIGTRGGLILFFKRGGALEFRPSPVLTAAKASGRPSVVTTRLECIRMPQTVCNLRRSVLSRPLFMHLVIPITAEFSL